MTAVIVAQADARQRAALRDPLRVGVVRWRGSEARLSVAIKLTLSYAAQDGDGPLVRPVVRVVEPQPISKALATEEEGWLEYPSDFVAFKPECDVLLVGHAYSTDATERIRVAAKLGDYRGSFHAHAAAPARAIALDNLFDDDGNNIRVGPRAVQRETDDDDFETFDHARMQAAPAQQRIASLAADADVAFDGLAPKQPQLAFQLPGLAPRAFLEDEDGVNELALRCDTVVVDSDYQRIVLVWRATLAVGAIDPHRVIVSLERVGQTRVLGLIERDLPHGTVGWAAEEEPVEADDDELTMAGYEVMEHAAERQMTLQQFATASARLAEQDKPRKDLLDELDLPERTWTVEERAWVEHMGDCAMAGDGTVAAEFATLFLAAQDQLKQPSEPRSIKEYADLKVALERAEDPKEVLAEREVSFGEWMRLERHYNDRAAADNAFAKELAETIVAARAAADSA